MDWSQGRKLLVLLVIGVGIGAYLMYGLTREPDVNGLWATAGCGGIISELLRRNDPLAVDIGPELLTLYG